MVQNTSDTLLEYFQNSATELKVKAEKAGVFGNRGDIGTAREDILLDFLMRHLPARCVLIKGGYIFDSGRRRSKQLDIIITNDLTLQFHQIVGTNTQKSFSCIEGAFAAISVKSILNKDELLDSIENLKSIPPVPDLIVNPLINTKGIQKRLPLKVIFAYSGLTCKTILTHLMEASKSVRIASEFPDLVIVNDSYYIWKVPSDQTVKHPVTRVKEGSLLALRDSKLIGGLALMQLITEIQKISNIGSHMVINFSNYMSAARDAAKAANQDPSSDIALNE